MADALVSGVLEQLTSIGLQVAESGMRLVVGVDEEVKQIRSTFQIIRALLVDAENRQVREQAIKLWLDKLEHVAYDTEDVLDEWRTAIFKSKIKASTNSPVSWAQPFSISIPRLVQRRDIAVKMKELNERLQAIWKEKDDYGLMVNNVTGNNNFEPERPKTTCFYDASEIRGRAQDKSTLISMLLSENLPEKMGIPIISIVGVGGIGKTTLAQMVYNDRDLHAYFQKKIWVCVSDPFDETRVAKAILESLTGIAWNLSELNTVLEKIHEFIGEKRFLLVLDDVWTEDERKWHSLKCCLSSGSQGSKILVTTRKENVAAIMGCTNLFHLGKLSEEECWSLFSHIAFSQRNARECESLNDISRKIADKCKGLPLAAKTLGGLLRFKSSREQWQNILDSHMWELDEAENELFSPLLLSYYDLPPPVRQCFSYCAILPRDHKIDKEWLIKLWMAQGFLGETEEKMEIVGEKYFDILAMRSFFQEFENDDNIIGCKMHDIVHEFAQFLRKSECFMVSGSGIEEPRVEYCYHENARHLILMLDDGDHVAIPDILCKLKKVRSLLVDSSHCYTSTINPSLTKIFDKLSRLRMLDLSINRFQRQTSLREIPIEIGRLIHLRYLNLEGNKGLEKLPDTLCDLCNLQSLNIRLCSSLKTLPGGIGRLINLKHLQNAETYGCQFMVDGMQSLTRLQTLDEFVVCNEYNAVRNLACSLWDLGSLAHLRGNLKIVGLGNVTTLYEAREAGLSSKTGLCNLTLSFNADSKDTTSMREEASFLEALQPPPYLEYLNINRLNGPTLIPSWMPSLTMLRKVILWACLNWINLPPMGKLSYLEHLEIWEMKKVKKWAKNLLELKDKRDKHLLHHCLLITTLRSLI